METPAKIPEALGARFGPMFTAFENTIHLGFLEARAPGSRQAAREHHSLSDVSSQVTLVLDYNRMWVPGCGVPNSVGICGQGSDFTG